MPCTAILLVNRWPCPTPVPAPALSMLPSVLQPRAHLSDLTEQDHQDRGLPALGSLSPALPLTATRPELLSPSGSSCSGTEGPGCALSGDLTGPLQPHLEEGPP